MEQRGIENDVVNGYSYGLINDSNYCNVFLIELCWFHLIAKKFHDGMEIDNQEGLKQSYNTLNYDENLPMRLLETWSGLLLYL